MVIKDSWWILESFHVFVFVCVLVRNEHERDVEVGGFDRGVRVPVRGDRVYDDRTFVGEEEVCNGTYDLGSICV